MKRNQCSEISAKQRVYILTGFVVTIPKLYKTLNYFTVYMKQKEIILNVTITVDIKYRR